MALVRAASFPLLVALAVGVWAALVRLGMNDVLALNLVLVPSFFAVWGLERLAPFRADWAGSDGQRWHDLGHMAFGTGLGGLLGHRLAEVIALSAVLFLPLPGSSWWTAMPFAAQVALVAVIADLGRYVQHRLLHRVPWLWRFHRLHHDGDQLDVFKTSRSHIVERITQQLAMFLPLLLLGAPHAALAWYIVPNAVFGLFSHCNADLRLGPLDGWLMGPAGHRVHHSAETALQTSNYGSMLVTWDRLFGTWSDPRRVTVGAVGLGDNRGPTTFLAQLVG